MNPVTSALLFRILMKRKDSDISLLKMSPFTPIFIDRYIPKTITIRTEKFSGKLKIEFRRTL
jgi:hypothetical protein